MGVARIGESRGTAKADADSDGGEGSVDSVLTMIAERWVQLNQSKGLQTAESWLLRDLEEWASVGER
jgi:hypothetical protein